MATDVTPSLEPPWWRSPKRGARAREPLSRDAIVSAAVRILDAEGADGLTVRRIAQELGTGPATLYWHISGKAELGELVYDRIMGEVELPPRDGAPWPEQLKGLAREAFRVMRAHPDLARLSLGRVPVGPNMLRIMEWQLGVLRDAGIPDRVAAFVGDLLGRYLDASVLEETMHTEAPSDDDAGPAGFERIHDYFAHLPAAAFPNTTALADEMFAIGAGERFELGLDILVRGLAALTEDHTPASA
jgi:AcrR family transcriptional regulator